MSTYKGPRRSVFDDGRYARIIDALYASILEDRQLTEALHQIVDMVGACSMGHFDYDYSTGTLVRSDTVGIHEQVVSEYAAHYGRKDPRVPAAIAMPLAQIYTERSLVDARTFRRTEVYDFLRRHDIPHIMAFTVSQRAGALSVIALQRTKRQQDFQDEAQRKFAPIVNHLQRVLRIRDLLAVARAQQSANLEVLSRLPFAIVLLDRTHRVIGMSVLGEALLSRHPALVYANGSVKALHDNDDRRLKKAIEQAGNPKAPPTDRGATLIIRGSSEDSELMVTVTPVDGAPLWPQSAACLLVIQDSIGIPVSSPEIVMRALRLTHAEAALACHLSTGMTLKDAAAISKLSLNTCKTQLKSIYQKTGWRNHVDLTKALVFASLAIQDYPFF